MPRVKTLVMVLAGTACTTVVADTTTQTYSNNFTGSIGGTGYGNAIGHYSNSDPDSGALHLTNWYNSAPMNYGTWSSGDLARPNATGPINSFEANFKFAFNNRGAGSAASYGFSFLFGGLSIYEGMSGTSTVGQPAQTAGYGSGESIQNFAGGEWGVQNFARLDSGLAIGFDTSDAGQGQGLNARWGNDSISSEASQPNGWLDPVTYGYANGSNGSDGAGGTGWHVVAAHDSDLQATASISWAKGGDLVVSIAFPGDAPAEYLRTAAFGDVLIGDEFSFGFAARTDESNSWDVVIDDFNVSYSYETPPAVPGPTSLALMVYCVTVRRRQR